MARRVFAKGECVGLHQACDTSLASAVLAVAIHDAEASPAAAAVAPAACVFVRATENVPGLMGEHSVDVVGTPTIVVVIHDQSRPADAGVGEVEERIFCDKSAIGPAST